MSSKYVVIVFRQVADDIPTWEEDKGTVLIVQNISLDKQRDGIAVGIFIWEDGIVECSNPDWLKRAQGFFSRNKEKRKNEELGKMNLLFKEMRMTECKSLEKAKQVMLAELL